MTKQWDGILRSLQTVLVKYIFNHAVPLQILLRETSTKEQSTNITTSNTIIRYVLSMHIRQTREARGMEEYTFKRLL